MAKAKKPDIERITGRYLDAWEVFGDEKFTTDELETELLRKRDPEDVPDSDKINQDLYRVSVIGLVEWFGDGQYRVSISPNADTEDWEELIENQTEWVHSEAAERLREREAESEDESSESDDSSPEILEYDTEKFMSAYVGPDSNLDSQVRYYQAALTPKSHDGVVLRSYQGVADATEKLAKEICDDNKISNTGCVYRFEIAEEEMVDVGDDLEYRVYLKETKLL